MSRQSTKRATNFYLIMLCLTLLEKQIQMLIKYQYQCIIELVTPLTLSSVTTTMVCLSIYYLHWASLIVGLEYGTEQWNGKLNGKLNGTVNIRSDN